MYMRIFVILIFEKIKLSLDDKIVNLIKESEKGALGCFQGIW